MSVFKKRLIEIMGKGCIIHLFSYEKGFLNVFYIPYCTFVLKNKQKQLLNTKFNKKVRFWCGGSQRAHREHIPCHCRCTHINGCSNTGGPSTWNICGSPFQDLKRQDHSSLVLLHSAIQPVGDTTTQSSTVRLGNVLNVIFK